MLYVRSSFPYLETKTGQNKVKSLNMVSLSPTLEVFLLRVLLAQFQICIWKAALNPYPPTLGPTEYVCKPPHQDQTPHRVPLPMNTLPAPAEVMSAMLLLLYTCDKSGIIYSIICKCSKTPWVICCNPLNYSLQTLSDSEDGQNSDADDEDEAWICIFIEGLVYIIPII